MVNLIHLLRTFTEHSAFRYVVVGGLGAVIEVWLFSYLITLNQGILFAHLLAFHLAFIFCFVCHQCYTYRSNTVAPKKQLIKTLIYKRFAAYTGLMYVQFFLGSMLLLVLINWLHIVPWFAKIIQIGIVTPCSYVIQKAFIFKSA